VPWASPHNRFTNLQRGHRGFELRPCHGRKPGPVERAKAGRREIGTTTGKHREGVVSRGGWQGEQQGLTLARRTSWWCGAAPGAPARWPPPQLRVHLQDPQTWNLPLPPKGHPGAQRGHAQRGEAVAHKVWRQLLQCRDSPRKRAIPQVKQETARAEQGQPRQDKDR